MDSSVVRPRQARHQGCATPPRRCATFTLKHLLTRLLIHHIIFEPDCARMRYWTVTLHNPGVAETGIPSLAIDLRRGFKEGQ